MGRKPNTLVENLNWIRNKGNCIRTLRTANRVLRDLHLAGHITVQEYTSLSIALAHVGIGEGTAEFNDLINRIIDKYSNNQLK